MNKLILKSNNIKHPKLLIFLIEKEKEEKIQRSPLLPPKNQTPQNLYQILTLKNNHSMLDMNFLKTTISREVVFSPTN